MASRITESLHTLCIRPSHQYKLVASDKTPGLPSGYLAGRAPAAVLALLGRWLEIWRAWERSLTMRPTPELVNALAWRRDFVLEREDLPRDPTVPLWTGQAALIERELNRRKAPW